MTKFDIRACRRLADRITAKADAALDYPTMLAFDGFARAWRRQVDLFEVDAEATASVDAYIGARVRQRRHELGLSTEDLAELCGVAAEQVERYEAGRAVIQAALVWRLSQGLNRPVEFFYPERTER